MHKHEPLYWRDRGFVSCSMYRNIIELFRATVPCVGGHLVLGQVTVQARYQMFITASFHQNQLCHEKRQGLSRYTWRRKFGRRIRITGRWYSSNTLFVAIIIIIVNAIELVHSTIMIRVLLSRWFTHPHSFYRDLLWTLLLVHEGGWIYSTFLQTREDMGCKNRYFADFLSCCKQNTETILR